MEQDRDFHLYLLIGQSNMAGRGEVEPQDEEIHPRVFALNRAGEWVLAADPIHFDKPIAGVGPGLTFGRTMASHDPSIRVGLIPCAAGGSPISVWKSGGYWEQTRSNPYDDAIERTRMAMNHGVLKGILWHQGESDSNENAAELYEDRLVTLITTLRMDLGMPQALKKLDQKNSNSPSANTRDVPFIAATLGDFVVESYPEARIINNALRRIPRRVQNTGCVDSKGLEHKGDNIHFSAEAARELGRRYAEAMVHLQQAISGKSD